MGLENAAITSGPRNVLGTTPGKSWWSYCKEKSGHCPGWASEASVPLLGVVPHLVYVQLVVQEVMCGLKVEALFYLGVGTCNKVDGSHSDQQP